VGGGQQLLTVKSKELVTKCYTGSRAGPCEDGNEPSSSIQGGELLDYLSGCWLLKKDSALHAICYTTNTLSKQDESRKMCTVSLYINLVIRGCIQKFPD
jgi:hypothetical protein